MQSKRRRLLKAGGVLPLIFLPLGQIAGAAGKPALAVTAERSHLSSSTDEALLAGVRLALQDIESAHGSASGSWDLLEHDGHSLPGRATAFQNEIAGRENLAGIFCGRFSPVAAAMMPRSKTLQMPLYITRASVSGLTEFKRSGGYTFRLAMRDDWALARLIDYSMQRGFRTLGILYPSSYWGRSCLDGVERKLYQLPYSKRQTIHRQAFNQVGETTLLPQYHKLLENGAQAILLIAAETEIARLAIEMVEHVPPLRRVPLISHWGITGGDTVALSQGKILELDVTFIQTFNFSRKPSDRVADVGMRAAKILKIANIHQFPSQSAFANAYDLTRMVGTAALSLRKITGPDMIRALEDIQTHQGIIRKYSRPFANGQRDAMKESDLFMSRYTATGRIIAID